MDPAEQKKTEELKQIFYLSVKLFKQRDFNIAREGFEIVARQAKGGKKISFWSRIFKVNRICYHDQDDDCDHCQGIDSFFGYLRINVAFLEVLIQPLVAVPYDKIQPKENDSKTNYFD